MGSAHSALGSRALRSVLRAPWLRGVHRARAGDIRSQWTVTCRADHAVVSKGKERPTLRDLGSSNGTFIRLRARRTLKHGDFMLVGQQLLRFEP